MEYGMCFINSLTWGVEVTDMVTAIPLHETVKVIQLIKEINCIY